MTVRETLLMPRPRQFETDTVIVDAIDLFWSRGYRGLSMDDLVRGCGVSRSSLYSIFSGKRELFLACLERYRDLNVPQTLGGLDAPDAALPEIESYFSGVIAELTGDGRRGCLVINSAAELGAEDPEVARIAWAHLKMLRDHFARALRNAGARGQIAAEALDPAAGASLLMATASGLILAGKANPDRRMLRAIARSALQAIGARA